MKKVLYLAAGNPITPGAGMDLVISEHIQELAAAPDLDVTFVAVAPGIERQPASGSHQLGRASVTLFVGDLLHEPGGLSRAFKKLRFILGRAVPVMAYSFKSDKASHHISRLLATQHYDVILIDHYYALANIDLGQLRRARARLIYVSHDAMLAHIAEMASMKPGVLAKAYYYLEAFRTHLVERTLFRMASKVIHLSEYERRQVHHELDKHAALLPPICSSDAAAASGMAPDSAYAQSVVFIGSPGHPPNAHAIDWILNDLAPALAQVAPHIQIALLGGKTDRLPIHASNVKGYGFVSAADMQRMLASCICSISPVVRGRGIKVKVLDAMAAGCPVLATEESLRGFEQFGLPPAIRLDDPMAVAQAISRLAQSAPARQEARAHMRQAWTQFLAQRTGQLAGWVRSLP